MIKITSAKTNTNINTGNDLFSRVSHQNKNPNEFNQNKKYIIENPIYKNELVLTRKDSQTNVNFMNL